MLAPLNLIDLMQRARELSGKYENVVIAQINDHVVRMSLMTEPYFWHYHPNSDETFIGLEGVVILELVNQRIELGPGQMFTVPMGMKHRTAPAGARSINLTIEHAEIATLVQCTATGRIPAPRHTTAQSSTARRCKSRWWAGCPDSCAPDTCRVS